jgi:branched-chain amino acid transport system ATP-binding protein
VSVAGSDDLIFDSMSVAYDGVAAISGVSLTVRAGEMVALLGANGAGKSSLMRAAMGLERGTGMVRLGGEPLEHRPTWDRARRGLAYVPEGRRMFPGLTALENLEVAARVPGGVRRKRLDRVVGIFPALAARLNARAWTLSGGEQQMVAIGRALMQGPRALMLDEPSLGLAPTLARAVFTSLRTIAASGVAVLVAEQNVREALGAADRGIVLARGRVNREGLAAVLAAETDLDALLLA